MPPAFVINGRFLTQPMTGVQRFAIQVTQTIDALIGSGEYAALEGRMEVLAPQKARAFPLRHIPVRPCGFGSGYLWEQLELPLFARDRFLLNFCGLGPVIKRNQLVVVHDAMVRARPENFSPFFRMAYDFLIPLLCRHSLCTATVSEFSRHELAKWYGVDISDMRVCYVGADHASRVTADASIVDRLGLRARKYFLFVGASNVKNAATAAAALQKANLPDTTLVVTGNRVWRVNGSRNTIATGNLCNAGYVTDGELRALYEHALATVAPSHYEGFGLPPVEAMSLGCPAIISNSAAMVEICGDAALQCRPDDADELSRLMRLLHDDPARRDALIAAGRARAARFTWRSTARALLDQCMEAVSAGAYARAVGATLPRTS